ncbi:hypothetical protein CU044_4926 [Streptomyces sp. L-9-10]|nr:hypothetical protein CU044_4926 [Streptomyces sp. L-9-10]
MRGLNMSHVPHCPCRSRRSPILFRFPRGFPVTGRSKLPS